MTGRRERRATRFGLPIDHDPPHGIPATLPGAPRVANAMSISSNQCACFTGFPEPLGERARCLNAPHAQFNYEGKATVSSKAKAISEKIRWTVPRSSVEHGEASASRAAGVDEMPAGLALAIAGAIVMPCRIHIATVLHF